MSRPCSYRRLPGALAALLLAVPAAASADPSPGGAQAPAPVQPAPAAGIVSVSGPVAVTARADTLLGEVARFRGTARSHDAGRRVVVQRFDDATARWAAVARTTVGKRGNFVARWRTDQIGRLRLRAILRPRAVTQSRGSAAIASAELGVTVYRPAPATWYGPGFFGKQTACGQTLTPDLVGVAHRRLPCGTQVAIFYGGRTLVVPVVDRGPYGGDADWDLTQAAAEALGMSASDTVGAVALP
jgi:rare lipoprotein A